MSKLRYKYCVVPGCPNTTVKTPYKIFFSMPVGKEVRDKWDIVMGRVGPKYKPLTSNRFCCEDHFDLPTDMENYTKFRLYGIKRFKLRKGVLPHKFDCKLGKQIVSDNLIKSVSNVVLSDNINNIRVEKEAEMGIENEVKIKVEKGVQKVDQGTSFHVDGTTQTVANDASLGDSFVVKIEYDSESSDEFVVELF